MEDWLAADEGGVEEDLLPVQGPPEQLSVSLKLRGATDGGKKRKRGGKPQKQAATEKVPELSDDEAQLLADQEGLHLLASANGSGYFGVYAGKGGRFDARVRRTPEGGGASIEVRLGGFASKKAAALCIAKTPEGQAAVASVASGGRLSNGGTGAQAPRWDAAVSGASKQEERAAAMEARAAAGLRDQSAAAVKGREGRAVKRAARRAARRAAKASRLLAFCKAMEAMPKSAADKLAAMAQKQARAKERRREQRMELGLLEAGAAQQEKRVRREVAERAIEQAVTEQKDGGRLEEKTRDTLHGFNGVSKALRAKALTLLSRDRAAQILAVTACKRSHVLGVPQLAALGAPPLPRASLPRKAPGGEPKHARRPWLKLPMLPTGAVRGGGKGWRRRGAPRGASPVSSQAVRRPHSVLRPDVLPAHRDYDADTQGVACSRASQSCLRLSQRWPRLCTERRVELGWQDCVRSPC